MLSSTTSMIDANEKWLEAVGIGNVPHSLFSQYQLRLPFSPWVKETSIDETTAMDIIVRCASMWSTTRWRVWSKRLLVERDKRGGGRCSHKKKEGFEAYFLRMQQYLYKRGVISQCVCQEKPISAYATKRLKHDVLDSSSVELLRPAPHTEGMKLRITFMDMLTVHQYVDEYERYLFDEYGTRKERRTVHGGRGTVGIRPTTYDTSARRTYVGPYRDVHLILLCCFFLHPREDIGDVELMNQWIVRDRETWLSDTRDCPLQLHWMASLLQVSTDQLLSRRDLPLESTKAISGHTLSRFYDGLDLEQELRVLYTKMFVDGDASSMVFTPIYSLINRSKLLSVLKKCGLERIRWWMNRSAFENMDLHDRGDSGLLRLSDEQLLKLRVDRCFSGDRISGGNFQSRLFVVLTWTTLFFADALCNSGLVSSTNTHTLAVSSLLVLLRSNSLQYVLEEFGEGKKYDGMKRDIVRLCLLIHGYFSGSVERVENMLKLMDQETQKMLANVHMNVVAYTQNLQWPPYRHYRQLMDLLIPTDPGQDSDSRPPNWNIVPMLQMSKSRLHLTPMEMAFGTGLVSALNATYRDEATMIFFNSNGVADTIPLLDAIYHMIHNILYFDREYQWWKRDGDDQETFSDDNDPTLWSRLFPADEELSSKNPSVMDLLNPSLFPCASTTLDRKEPVIMPKAMFSITPVPLIDNQCAWLARWNVDVHHLRDFDMDFVYEYTNRLLDVLRLGAYTLYTINQAIVSHGGNTSSGYIRASKCFLVPCYPILGCTLQRIYETYTLVQHNVLFQPTDDHMEEEVTIYMIRQALESLMQAEAVLAMRCLESRSLLKNMIDREGRTRSYDTLKHEGTYSSAPSALFFVLSIPTVWNLLSSIGGGEEEMPFDYRLNRLHCFFRLFSLCEQMVHLHDLSDSSNKEALPLMTSHAIHVRRKRKALGIEKDELEECCPTLLGILERKDLFIHSATQTNPFSKSKKEYDTAPKRRRIDTTEDSYQDSEEYEEVEEEDEEEVKVERSTSARWFFFSPLDWTQFLLYCLRNVWKDQDLFAELVKELFLHGFSISEYERVKHHTLYPSNEDPSGKEDSSTQQRIESDKLLFEALGCKDGYLVGCEFPREWNAFAGVSFFLEYYPYYDEIKTSTTTPFSGFLVLSEYVMNTEERSLEYLLWNAPLDVTVLVERRGVAYVTTGKEKRRVFQVLRYGREICIPSQLPGLGWQYFSGRNVSSLGSDLLYLFGRTTRGFI